MERRVRGVYDESVGAVRAEAAVSSASERGEGVYESAAQFHRAEGRAKKSAKEGRKER